MPHHLPIAGERDDSRFLRDDNGKGIGLLGNAHCRPMPRAQVLQSKRVAFRERQYTGGRQNASPAHNDSTIVERRIGEKDGLQQIRDHQAIDTNTRLGIVLKPRLTLNDNKSAVSPL